MYTQLKSRTLWFDGDVEVPEDKIIDFPYPVCVKEITKDIERYNRLVPKHQQILKKTSLSTITPVWNIPEPYDTLNITQHVLMLFEERSKHCSDEEFEIRLKRTMLELSLFRQYNLVWLLRTMVYIIDTFKQNNVVWGVGRGSSVSSFVLYLIGVHDIDAVKYNLDEAEFFH